MAYEALPGDRPLRAADEALDRAQHRMVHPVTRAVPAAAIRRRIRIPLRLADGYSTAATVVSFTGLTDAQQHVALELGRPAAAQLPLVRLHSECLTGDVFGSQRCDCGPQLREAVERITNHGGYVLHLTGTNAAYLATKVRRGGHDLLSRNLDRTAGPHRHAGPLAGPGDLGFEAR